MRNLGPVTTLARASGPGARTLSAAPPLARRLVARGVRAYGEANRRRKSRVILEIAAFHGLRDVILVGAAAVTGNAQDGIVERSLDGPLVVRSACNIEPLPLPWPSVVGDARRLPYRTDAVDLVVSNAVLEHVGGAQDQAAFVAEHARVGRMWVLTTPNRHFPVEAHTGAVLRHWSPAWRARQGDFTRLLSKRELGALLPPGSRILGRPWSPTLMAVGGEAHRGLR